MSSIWVDKYKPQSTNQLIGQNRNVIRIKSWLKTFEPSKSRPLFIYGPPGIGKTTAAHLCCKEMGFQTIEFNASDQRNKNTIKDIISVASSNSRLNLFGKASTTKDAIILDEIDGMAGNEDRGGIGQLIIELKSTKKPMIFICNDGQHQKLRSLKDKCETLEFKKPEYEALRMVVNKIAREEKLDIDKINIKNLAESTSYDIRQIINSLSLFRDSSVDQLTKTTRLNAFEATRKALISSKQTLDERFEYFFADYNIMSLFMFENYHKFTKLEIVSRAAHALSLSDLADKQIRTNQNWSLLNTQALLSTVIPSCLVSSALGAKVDFPQYLGKLSNINKRSRINQELNSHMCLSLRGGLDPDYLDVMCRRISDPLIKKGSGGIDSVIDFMNDYSLLRDDLNSIMELATWSFKPDPMTKVDSKTKTALTLAYKKRSIALPYFIDEKVSKKRRVPLHAGEYDNEDSEDEDEEEVEEVIKPKRVIKTDKQKAEKAKVEKPKVEKPKVERAKKNGINGKHATSSQESIEKANEKTVTVATKPDKRPPENGGIARFFTAKKKKTSE